MLQVCITAIWSQGLILNLGRSYATFGTNIPVFRANSGSLLGTKWQKWLIYKNVSRIVKIEHSEWGQAGWKVVCEDAIANSYSSEIRGFCSTTCSGESLQNLPYFWKMKTHVFFFFFQKYGKFWSISLDLFIEHKLLNC